MKMLATRLLLFTCPVALITLLHQAQQCSAGIAATQAAATQSATHLAGMRSTGPTQSVRDLKPTNSLVHLRHSDSAASRATPLRAAARTALAAPSPGRQTSLNVSNPKGELDDVSVASHANSLGEYLADTLASFDCYLQLLGRVHNWAVRFNALTRDGAISTGQNALEAITEEFSRADEKLASEECSPGEPIPDEDPSGKGFNAWDFLFRVIRRVIDELERHLVELEGQQKQDSSMVVDEVPEVDDRSAAHLMEKVKKSALRAAKGIISSELQLGQTVLLRFTQPVSSPLGYLQPLLALVASARQVKPVAKFMRDPELRGALAILHEADPMLFARCASNRRPSAYC